MQILIFNKNILSLQKFCKTYSKKLSKTITMGRKPKDTAEKKATEKETTKKVAEKKETKEESPKKERAKKEKKAKEEPEQVAEISLDEQIYGHEPEKPFVNFSQSDLQTQTRNLIKEYGINVAKLPQPIFNSVNLLIQEFNVFVTNPNQYNMIGGIMEKDQSAFDLLNKWVENKKELLKQNKKEEKVENPTAPQVQQAQQSQVFSSANLTPPSNIDNIFNPREPVSSYQHNVTPPAPSPFNPLNHNITENKNIHYEILSKASAQIIANDTAQQNWQGEPNRPVIDKDKILGDYCNSILTLINSTFQMAHWGYIPIDAVNQIVNNCDKLYVYEIVNNGSQSYIKVSSGNNSANTGFFTIK